MKKQFYMNAAIIVLLWFACGTLHAQKYNLKTEVLVYIMPDSLELPVQEKGKLGLQRATIKSSALAITLTKIKVTGIAKAFPAWTNKDSIVTQYDGEQIQAPPFHRIFTLTFNSETDADSAIIVLKQSGAVLFAEKHTEPTFDNDQFYVNGTQWYMNNDGRNGGVVGADINAEGAWAIYTGSSANKIAIIDTGVVLTHEDLSGKVTGENHFGNSHGTMVAGVAAAKANNTYGIRGVDWNAQIISKNISDIYGNYIGDAAVAQKIMDAVNEGANVLNRSGSSPDYSSTLGMAFAYAYKMNRVSVATMGNTGIQQVRYPAALPNVIAVGATLNNDVISNFSTTGNHIDVVAPGGINRYPFYDGRDIFTTTIGNTYDFTSGTSFSAPQVTGLASLLKGYRTNLSNDDIRQIIQLSADKVPAMMGNNFTNTYGYGRINAGRALSYLTNPYSLVQRTASSGTIVSTSNQYVAQFIGASGLATGNYLVKRIEVKKTVTLPTNIYNIVGAWGRGVFTSGWSAASPNFGEGFCEVVPGSLTGTSVTLRTYVYQVWNIAGSYLGYYPTSPSNVTFAYSVLGLEKPSLTGPSVVCNRATYAIENLPQGSTVQWSLDYPLEILSGQGTGSITIINEDSTAYAGIPSTINATITINGQIVNLSKLVQAGTPEFDYFDHDEPYVMNVLDVKAFFSGADYYTWTKKTGNVSIELDQGNTSRAFISIFSANTIRITVTAFNSCGSWEEDLILYPQNNKSLSWSVYPNPANAYVIITFDKVGEQSVTTDNRTSDTHTIQLWNSFGMIRSVQTNQKDYHLDLGDIPSGFYYIHIINNEKIYRQSLIINR